MSIYFYNINKAVSKYFLDLGISTSASSRLVAKAWRNICGVICNSIAAREVYL